MRRMSIGKIRACAEALEAVNRAFQLCDNMHTVGAPDLVDAMSALAREIRDHVDQTGDLQRLNDELRALKANEDPYWRVEERV